MTNAKKAMRRKPLLITPIVLITAALLFVITGCISNKTVKAPSQGGVSGTDQALSAPNAPPALKSQAVQQQQMALQQAQAQQQAHQQSAGQRH